MVEAAARGQRARVTRGRRRGAAVRCLALCLLAPLAACGGAARQPSASASRPILISSTATPLVYPPPSSTPAAVTTASPSATPTSVPVAVTITGAGYSPASITVSRGAFVVWTNRGASPHTVTADGGAFDSGTLKPGQVFTFVFPHRGTFAYHCGWQPSMHGAVIVR